MNTSDDDGENYISGHGFPRLGNKSFNGKMPFGKYKGRDIEDLPSSYLRWLSENIKDTQIVEACLDLLDHREDLEGCIYEIY